MKVCLINPPTSRPQDALFFPMGLLTIGSVLAKYKIPVEIIDLDLELRHFPELRDNFQDLKNFASEKIALTCPDVVGITGVCSNFPLTLEIAKFLRKQFPEKKIVLGGPQPSSVPHETLELFPEIDAIVIGEGEESFLELIKSDWTETALRKIKGIMFRHGHQICRTEPRPLLEDLDDLPMPDFSLVDVSDYLSYTPSIALIEAGRGCPFRCTFCSTAEMWSRKYRVKSPGRIREEMKILNRDYSLTYFQLTHDNFTTSPKYVRKFCEYFLENNKEEFTWNCSARTDTLKIDDLNLMHRAGCRGLFYGVDSGSKNIQKVIDKNLDLEEYKVIIQETVKRGIYAIASFIIGFPEETLDDFNDTLELGLWSKHVGVNEVQFHRLAPLASTKVFRDNFDWLTFRPIVSDLSTLIYFDLDIIETVQNHPILFSSFFEVPSFHRVGIDALCLANFFQSVVNDIGVSFYWYLKRMGRTPVSFYQEWYSNQTTTTYDQLLTKSYILESAAECF